MTKADEMSNLSLAQASSSEDPFDLFALWMAEAEKTEPNDPNAMALATVDPQGMPSVRMVLLKGLDPQEADPRGFVFYTNLESQKGQDLAQTPKAGLCFHWKSLRRQIRIQGAVSPVTTDEADAYFASRSRGSQIGAWASAQSRPLEGRWALEKQVALYTAKFNIGNVPRPDHWSGFRICPERIEFWQDRDYRLHDRFVFTKETKSEEQGHRDLWHKQALYP